MVGICLKQTFLQHHSSMSIIHTLSSSPYTFCFHQLMQLHTYNVHVKYLFEYVLLIHLVESDFDCSPDE